MPLNPYFIGIAYICGIAKPHLAASSQKQVFKAILSAIFWESKIKGDMVNYSNQ